MDWVAAAFNLLGLWLLADHGKAAIYCFLISSSVFLVWGILNKIWSIVALQSVLILLNIRVLYKWRHNGS